MGCPINLALYKRYMDDIFAFVESLNDAFILLDHLNLQHPTIKFELELPYDQNSLSLLDLKIIVSGNIVRHTFYQKKAKKDLFIHSKSAQPLDMKSNSIKAEYKRINRLSSDDSAKMEGYKHLENKLEKVGYSKKQIIDHKNANNPKIHNQSQSSSVSNKK